MSNKKIKHNLISIFYHKPTKN